jgi:hypothetical protein
MVSNIYYIQKPRSIKAAGTNNRRPLVQIKIQPKKKKTPNRT